jgi:hypothetical protein
MVSLLDPTGPLGITEETGIGRRRALTEHYCQSKRPCPACHTRVAMDVKIFFPPRLDQEQGGFVS